MSSDVDGYPRVEVVLQLGFDDESDRALQAAWEAAKELLDEGVWVDLVPQHSWFTDPMGFELSELPKVIINGFVAVVGRAPDKDELVELILDILEDSVVSGGVRRIAEQSA